MHAYALENLPAYLARRLPGLRDGSPDYRAMRRDQVRACLVMLANVPCFVESEEQHQTLHRAFMWLDHHEAADYWALGLRGSPRPY